MQTELQALHDAVEKMQASLDRVEDRIEKINRRQKWSAGYGFLKLLLVIVPLIYGIWYLQPYLKTMYASWETIMQSFGLNPSAGDAEQLNTDELIKQYIRSRQLQQ